MSSNLPVANSKDVIVYLPTGIDSVNIKSAICGCINCIPLQYGGAPDPSIHVLVM